MGSLLFSAAHKSSGKTTLSIGVCAALARRGLKVQPFKKGPDYIDPIWLAMAAGKACYNLDFYIAGEQETVDDFHHRRQGADIAIIEGNKGLHDGLDLDGGNSNAALAKALNTPVIMVVDARGTMRGIAPLLLGYQMFDRDVRIAGVIANMTGGKRHESKLRAAVERYTDIPFLGSLEKRDEFELTERHLGLIPGYEDPESQARIEIIARAVEECIDLDRIVELGDSSKQPSVTTPDSASDRVFKGLRIGIVQDRAFGFYYPGDLEAMQEAGAELIRIDALHDTRLPEIDGLFIGGGFPERHAEALQQNSSLRNEIRLAIESGLPAYAECGGIMYLSQSLSWQEQTFEMAGVIPAKTIVHERPQGRGYVKLTENDRHPWPFPPSRESVMHAHEFHYSALENFSEALPYAYRMTRGYGISGVDDGLVYKNLLGSYTHLRNTAQTPWVRRFLSFVQNCKAPHLDKKMVSGI